ncbi:FAD-dependent oxidoreductase [Sphaerisporangium sp. TRM90804]|uniref:NAD(P)/FAD-dependent oxidoreductase n=1 Tax=Sphaerisporangium sp. TRM90804 TaxID=3031113 RepID=UPI00244C606B|nr:FAD-dependent oxidoreductase [Sphaerisporangium sp. TRM90804]MDH2424340.1 FAD-dependent oxidoreductase [Sphaerisporangium sp. TRM90804]
MRETCEVAVIGGGVIGCAVAHRLAAEGRRVTILDASGRLGSGATDAAMGGILTQSESSCLGPLSTVIDLTRRLYPAWLARLTDQSRVPVPVLTGGDIQVALDDDEMTHLTDKVLPEWEASPFAVVRLSREDAKELEPLLSDAVRGGFLLPDELALDPHDLMAALAGALPAVGVGVRLGARVMRVGSGPGGAEVELDDGTVISAETVVVAAGHLSGVLLPRFRHFLYPVKGEALDARPPGARTYPLRHHVYAELDGGLLTPYLVPRSDGRVALGVTYEPGVDDLRPSAKGRDEVLRGAAALMPSTTGWVVEKHWAGLRPGSGDKRPLIGYADEHRRVVVATGHSGLGVTLAPATAELVSVVMSGTTPDAETAERLAVCAPERALQRDLAAAAAPSLRA